MQSSFAHKLLRPLAAVLCAVLLATGSAAAAEGAAKEKPAKAAETKPKAKAKKGKKAAPAASKAKKEEPAEPKQWELPWRLRAKFTMKMPKTDLVYFMDNAQWVLAKPDTEQVIVDKVGMTITLADGRTLNVVEFDKGTSNFQKVESEFGPVQRYWAEMAPREGLQVHHTMDVLINRPVSLIYAEIKNVGDKPVEIAKIAPAVLDKGIVGLSPNATMGMRHASRRAQFVTYDPSAPRMAIFQDPANGYILALGVLPLEGVPTDVNITKQGNAYVGKIESRYEPAAVLKPGETLKTAPVWLSFTAAKPKDEDANMAWVQFQLPKPKVERLPDAWATVAADQPAAALVQVAQAWQGSKMKHVLVPAPWFGPEGASFDAAALARELKGLKMVPGLTLAPLGVQGAPENLTVAAGEGKRWLNAALPEARKYAAEQFSKMVKWDYEFFVLAPTSVPAGALKAMGLTSAQADAFAFEIATQAADGRPVLPAATATLDGNVDGWLEAAAHTGRCDLYGVPAGPVRLDAAKAGDPNEALTMALSFYGGPIEVVGAPSGKLKALFPRPPVRACAIDALSEAPKAWEVRHLSGKGSDLVVEFPGAPAWTDADLEPDVQKPVKRMKVEDGKVTEAKNEK